MREKRASERFDTDLYACDVCTRLTAVAFASQIESLSPARLDAPLDYLLVVVLQLHTPRPPAPATAL